jgi:hypothetical protein
MPLYAVAGGKGIFLAVGEDDFVVGTTVHADQDGGSRRNGNEIIGDHPHRHSCEDCERDEQEDGEFPPAIIRVHKSLLVGVAVGHGVSVGVDQAASLKAGNIPSLPGNLKGHRSL